MTATEIIECHTGERVQIQDPGIGYTINGTIERKLNGGKNGIVVLADNGDRYWIQKPEEIATTKKLQS